MNPASQEYFRTYETLVEAMNSFKTQQTELRFQVSKLFEENKRLTNELKENIILREQQISETSFGDLERKLQAAVASKNAALEMWQEALKQLEKQEEQLIGKKSLVESERGESEKLIQQIKEEYIKGLNILSVEVTNYRNELAKVNEELLSKTVEYDNCKDELKQLRDEVTQNRTIISDLSSQKSEMLETITSLRTLLSETEKFLSSTKEEMSVVKTENAELSSQVADLKEQNKKLRNEIIVVEKDAKESLLTAQEAILKKKEMAYREEQFMKEIEHLKQTMDIEAEKVAFKYKAELKEIQKQSNEKINSLMEEIQALHQENSDKQSLFEKASREKQALESKLELLYSENSSGLPSSAFDDLCKRLTVAERSRDENEFKVKSLQIELAELRAAKEQEIHCLQEEDATSKSRLQKLLEDFNQSSLDRIKLNDEVTKLKKKCSDLEKELKKTKTATAAEVFRLREESQQKQDALNKQLHSSEEHYKNVCSELQQLLNSEFKISSKWKEEVDDLIVKSETKIKELCQTIANLQDQNKELMNALGQRDSYLPNLTAFT
ncbi:Sodium channel and clathrin linker 1 like protein [Argiope bruennichi]|uniref:Sodium channel and clathrin linker 1 like protein n=1 Tax=Argiope bruennichi TaxID=94029 RepID=A0A8T0ENG6_ARGBR|nr:Sodium channel and clathrin linker 1 like protein [Argiope bruennichi]